MAKKILIVEDDFDTRYVLSLILKEEGYEVITAADGECALGVASEQKPDLIITDIHMPRLNGIELTRKLRLKAEMAALPIIAITAYGAATQKTAIAAGVSACATKPIAMNEFLLMIADLLAQI
jgi:two-component system, cell cycle response regulator DivK